MRGAGLYLELSGSFRRRKKPKFTRPGLVVENEAGRPLGWEAVPNSIQFILQPDRSCKIRNLKRSKTVFRVMEIGVEINNGFPPIQGILWERDQHVWLTRVFQRVGGLLI